MEIFLFVIFLVLLSLFIIGNQIEIKWGDDYPEDFHNDDCLFEVKQEKEE
jgi:hypothetical protein